MTQRSPRMTYPPQQPGGWPDPSWPGQQQQQQPYQDPNQQQYVDPNQQYVDPNQQYSAQPYSGQPYAENYGSYGQAYQQPAPVYGYGAPAVVPVVPKTNGMAIASLICSLVGLVTCGVASIVGIILGFVAKKQIQEKGEEGGGMATAGIIIGFVAIALSIIAIVFWVWYTARVINNIPTYDPTLYPTD